MDLKSYMNDKQNLQKNLKEVLFTKDINFLEELAKTIVRSWRTLDYLEEYSYRIAKNKNCPKRIIEILYTCRDKNAESYAIQGLEDR